MLILGLVRNVLFNNIIAGIDSCFKHSIIIDGYIQKFSDCRYIKYSLRDYIDENAFKQANEFSFWRFARDLGWKVGTKNIEEEIQILVVKKGASGVCPSQLATYTVPFDNSYIFVRDEPDKIKGVGKFFVYHEVGHTLYTTTRHKLRLVISNKTFFFFLFWSLWTVIWTFQSILVAVCLVLTSITMLREWKRRFNASRLEDEMWADIFAISALSDEDRIRVARFFLRYPLPPDPDLDKQQNSLRFEHLNQNLALAEDNKTKENNIPRMFTFENVSDIYAPLEIVTASILVIVLGTFGQEPSTNFLIKTLLFLDLPIFIILLAVAFLDLYLKNGIEQFVNSKVSSEV
ncbi:hypothetical protein H6G27_33735 [Nostoc linckia FACHB-104]|nr:hypothetical protein [Nostoc linckia FACHB-104]